jgi:hypothetical protein
MRRGNQQVRSAPEWEFSWQFEDLITKEQKEQVAAKKMDE